MQTKAFKSGNSLAVRIPKDLAIFEPSQDVIIERKGDTLVLRAVERKSLEQVMDIFAGFSPGFMAEGRLPQDQDERDWGTWLPEPERDRTSYSVQQPKAVYHAQGNAPRVPAKTTKVAKKAAAKSTP